LKQDRRSEARSLMVEAVETVSKLPSINKSLSIELATLLYNLAAIERGDGLYAQAEATLRRSIELRAKVLGSENAETLFAKNLLGVLLVDQEKWGEAEPILRDGLKAALNQHPETHPLVSIAKLSLGVCLLNAGKLDEADTLLNAALKAQEASLTADNVELGKYLGQLALLRVRQNRPAEGETIARRALELRVAKLPADSWLIDQIRVIVGVCQAAQGKMDEAQTEMLPAAEAILDPACPASPARKMDVVRWVIGAYEAAGREAEAKVWRARRAAMQK
jgi:tetratricopeptide (TPR) repeat protein